MEIVDEMKLSYDQIKEIVLGVEENLKSSDVKRRLKAVNFLEILVKNCEISFHH